MSHAPCFTRHPLAIALLALAALGSGCRDQDPPPTALGATPLQAPQAVAQPMAEQAMAPTVQPAPPATEVVPQAAPQSVASVYVEPPLVQPAPVLVDWAPPPMLVEAMVPQPYPDAVWVGGYWDWRDNWVWSTGHWMRPPRPQYTWVHPYYEHRDRNVVFITGHWRAPGTAFVPPPRHMALAPSRVAPGIRPGWAPIGPQGVFVPPPPGSRPGLIVPAPVGTPPAVMAGAAPVMRVGMHVQGRPLVVNNISVTNNVTQITRTRNLTIVAPASATVNGRPFQRTVMAQATPVAPGPAVVGSPRPVPAPLTTAVPAQLPAPALVPGPSPSAVRVVPPAMVMGRAPAVVAPPPALRAVPPAPQPSLPVAQRQQPLPQQVVRPTSPNPAAIPLQAPVLPHNGFHGAVPVRPAPEIRAVPMQPAPAMHQPRHEEAMRQAPQQPMPRPPGGPGGAPSPERGGRGEHRGH